MSIGLEKIVAYTYLIGWKQLDRWYYGVRFAKNCVPGDLWVKYRTSSKFVKQFVEIHGDPDVVEVRQTFQDIDIARNFEKRVLKKLKVPHNERFLNRTNNRCIRNTPEECEKISQRMVNLWKLSPNRNDCLKGRNLSDEHKELISKSMKGKHLSNETKEKISNSMIERYEKTDVKKRLSSTMKEKIFNNEFDMSKLYNMSLLKRAKEFSTPWGIFFYITDACKHELCDLNKETLSRFLKNPNKVIVKHKKYKDKTPVECGFFYI